MMCTYFSQNRLAMWHSCFYIILIIKLPMKLILAQLVVEDVLFILSCVLVIIDGVLDWTIGFIAPYTFTQFGTAGNTALSLSTFTHALGFSAFTSRILATDLSQSHCNFRSHMKSSWHSLIPVLPFLLSRLGLPSAEPIQFSRLLFYSPSVLRLCPFIIPQHGPHGKHRLLLFRRRVYSSVT
jgi:hypothetical protein